MFIRADMQGSAWGDWGADILSNQELPESDVRRAGVLYACQWTDKSSYQNRPNGPGEPSPGLRPKADALGRRANNQAACRAARVCSPSGLSSLILAALQAAWFGLLPRASAFGL